MNAADWTIIKIVEQMETNADHFRRDMQSMKDAIQIMYVSQQQQMVDLKDIAQQAQVQQNAYVEQSKEVKTFKDQFDNLRVAEDFNDIMRKEMESMKAKIDMLQKVAEDHAGRENRMFHYLETLDQQRLAEGQTVIHAFKSIAQDVAEVQLNMRGFSDHLKDHIALTSGVAAGPGGMTAMQS